MGRWNDVVYASPLPTAANPSVELCAAAKKAGFPLGPLAFTLEPGTAYGRWGGCPHRALERKTQQQWAVQFEIDPLNDVEKICAETFNMGVGSSTSGQKINISNAGIDLSDVPVVALDPAGWGLPTTSVYQYPFGVTLNEKPAVNCAFFVTAPPPPLLTTAGIFGFTAQSPSHKDKHMLVQIVVAYRGKTPVEPEETGGDDKKGTWESRWRQKIL